MDKKRPSDYLINGIVKSYTALDNNIMKGVNAGVRGWNWLTGETKAQLANKFLTTVPILMTVGIYGIPEDTDESISRIFPSACLGFIFIGANHFYQKKNIEIERLEQMASETELIDISVLKLKEIYRVIGPLNIGVSVGMYPGYTDRDLGFLVPLGFSCQGISNYIMRADSVPPRKNVFLRATDKLAEIVRNYRTKPLLEPSRVPVN